MARSFPSVYRRWLAHSRARQAIRRLSRAWDELDYAQARLLEQRTGLHGLTHTRRGTAK